MDFFLEESKKKFSRSMKKKFSFLSGEKKSEARERNGVELPMDGEINA